VTDPVRNDAWLIPEVDAISGEVRYTHSLADEESPEEV
jgi:hypothetical protein